MCPVAYPTKRKRHKIAAFDIIVAWLCLGGITRIMCKWSFAARWESGAPPLSRFPPSRSRPSGCAVSRFGRHFWFVCRPLAFLAAPRQNFHLIFRHSQFIACCDTPDRRGVVPRGPIEGALHPPRCWGCLRSSGKRGTHSPLHPLCTFSVGFPVRSGTPCAVGIATKKA